MTTVTGVSSKDRYRRTLAEIQADAFYPADALPRCAPVGPGLSGLGSPRGPS